MVLSLEGPVNPLPSSLSHHPSPITPLSSLFHHPSLSCFQVYAPISGQERSFHRTIFVFCCKTHECYTCNNNRCVKGNIAASLASSSSQNGRLSSASSLLWPMLSCSHRLTFMLLSVFRSQLPRRNEFYSFHPPPGGSQSAPRYNW